MKSHHMLMVLGAFILFIAMLADVLAPEQWFGLFAWGGGALFGKGYVNWQEGGNK